MERWKVTLWLRPDAVKLLVKAAQGDDVLKAQLPAGAGHPRALLTLLEGLALWCGTPLCVAIAAGGPVNHSLGLGPCGELDVEWPAASPLVRFEFLAPRGSVRRIRAGFRPLPSLSRAWRRS